jgi:hypothetical protein
MSVSYLSELSQNDPLIFYYTTALQNFLPVYQTTDELHIEPVTQGSATGQTATEIT